MTRHFLVGLTAAAILGAVALAPTPARADPVTFSKGALIIPMQSYFQKQGGMVSTYGLVYRILLANKAGHLNETQPVTVYIVNSTTKSSPNRCIPWNNAVPNGGVTTPNDAKWTDGCDFSIENLARQPVVPVDYSVGFPASPGIYPDAPVPNFDDSTAWPRYNTATLTTAGGFTKVNYLGGPFVIDFGDAPQVINLLRNGDVGPDAVPKAAIDIYTDGQKKFDAAHCDPQALDDSVTAGSGCTCVPKTCATGGWDCGDAGDGCGGELNCSPTHVLGDVTCANAAETCGLGGPNQCGSVSSGSGKPCGKWTDGCQGDVDCNGGASCGAWGDYHHCGAADVGGAAANNDGLCHPHRAGTCSGNTSTPCCTKRTNAWCDAQGTPKHKQGGPCGHLTNLCGDGPSVDCGGCDAGGVCVNNVCKPAGTACAPKNNSFCNTTFSATPATCTDDIPACTPGMCGWVGQGCGTAINCGACPSGQLCGINVANQCTTPTPQISSGCHYVFMHQATTGFSANVSRRINHSPHTFAVYQSYNGDVNRNGSPASGVLATYIKIAGLWLQCTGNHVDTIGCPVGNVSNCTFNGSTPAGLGVEAGLGQVYHGSIYDQLDTRDMDYTSGTYAHGALNYQPATSTSPFYSLFWAPHWHTISDGNGNDRTGQASVGWFINHQGNLMTECASITSYENGFGAPTWTLAAGADSGPNLGTNFLFTAGIQVGGTNGGRNCSDPGAPGTCTKFPTPGNVFAQIGDWIYYYKNGENDGFKKLAASLYQSWTQVMVTGSNGQDAFDMGQPSAVHGAIVYVAGHDVSDQPVGSRIVLNSTLNLSGDPTVNERGLTPPVIAYANSDALAYVDETLVGTYGAVSGYPTNPSVQSFDAVAAKLWVFPYFPGYLRAHPLTGGSALPVGVSTLNTATQWEVNLLHSPSGMEPAPLDRNLFTYFGGYPKSFPAASGKAPDSLLQVGWWPEKVDGFSLAAATETPGGVASGCVDVLGVNNATITPVQNYDSCERGGATCTNNALRLVAGPDGMCDLQEAMNFSAISDNANWGAAAGQTNHDMYVADKPGVAFLLQRVRGYCYAGDISILRPAPAACQDSLDDRAHMGAVARSTPAVIGPSKYIVDAPANKHRPTVSYVGGYDGQLHAFYVGGGSGYTGPGSTLNFPYANVAATDGNHDASKVFAHDFSADFAGGTPPAQGTELWSFLPATQLPRLPDNSARVDSSSVVLDVQADFGFNGEREWHTVLLTSMGAQGTELFALDITNPLKPRLLWDIVGTSFVTGSVPYFSPTIIMNDSLTRAAGTATCNPTGFLSPLPGTCASPKWNQENAYYTLPPGADNPNGLGRIMTKVYDYQDLGGSSGLAAGPIRIGLEPAYVVYVASNMPQGKKGIEVFAIEVSTGQKLWQWEHAYTKWSPTPSDLDNLVPPPVSLQEDQMGTSRLLVGDFEGRLWELDAATGANVNTSSVVDVCNPRSTPCSFPAFDAYNAPPNSAAKSQPISTNISVARVPSSATAPALLADYKNATIILLGTAGSDALASPGAIPGRLHVLLWDPQYRVPIFSSAGGGKDLLNASVPFASAAAAGLRAKSNGVLQEPTGFPDTFPVGERIYGTITVSGDLAFFTTATGPVPSDIMKLAGNIGGNTYEIDLGTAAAGSVHSAIGSAGHFGNFGGVAVYLNADRSINSVLGSEVSQVDRIAATFPGAADGTADASKAATPKSLTYKLQNWILQFLRLQ